MEFETLKDRFKNTLLPLLGRLTTKLSMPDLLQTVKEKCAKAKEKISGTKTKLFPEEREL